jgi:hypothetical protein
LEKPLRERHDQVAQESQNKGLALEEREKRKSGEAEHLAQVFPKPKPSVEVTQKSISMLDT